MATAAPMIGALPAAAEVIVPVTVPVGVWALASGAAWESMRVIAASDRSVADTGVLPWAVRARLG